MTAAGRTFLAFDYGTRRMGIAVGQSITGSATPLKLLAMKNGRPQPAQLDKLVGEWSPAGFVLGMPAGPQAPTNVNIARRVKSFAGYLRRRYRKPCFFVDERLSSRVIAARHTNTNQAVDSEVAQALLGAWLAEQYKEGQYEGEHYAADRYETKRGEDGQ